MPQSRSQLWHGINHDRNGHFNFGLDLVLELKALDPLHSCSTSSGRESGRQSMAWRSHR
jgi:hypothetical protein